MMGGRINSKTRKLEIRNSGNQLCDVTVPFAPDVGSGPTPMTPRLTKVQHRDKLRTNVDIGRGALVKVT